MSRRQKEVRHTDTFIILRGDTGSIVDNFDGLESVVNKPDVYGNQREQHVNDGDVPMLVAAASRLFSTSSFTAVCRSTTTWPDVILCTE